MMLTLDDVARELRAALLTVLADDDFDLTTDDRPGALDVSTDDWTLQIEDGVDGVAWFAVDDEPDDPTDYTATRRLVMTTEVEAALAAANARLGGLLTRLLLASDDPFSADLAAALCDEQP